MAIPIQGPVMRGRPTPVINLSITSSCISHRYYGFKWLKLRDTLFIDLSSVLLTQNMPIHAILSKKVSMFKVYLFPPQSVFFKHKNLFWWPISKIDRLKGKGRGSGGKLCPSNLAWGGDGYGCGGDGGGGINTLIWAEERGWMPQDCIISMRRV